MGKPIPAGGGVGLDIPSAARAVITDWTTGQMRACTIGA